MTWFDFLLLGLVLLSTFFSYRQGFVMEVTYFVSFLGGLIGSLLVYPWVSPFFTAVSGGEYFGSTGAFILVFLFIAGGIALVGVLCQKFLQFLRLGGIDRLAGAVVGFLKAVLGIAVFVVVLTGIYGPRQPGFLENSLLCRPLVRGSTTVMERVPTLFENFMSDYGNRAKEWIARRS